MVGYSTFGGDSVAAEPDTEFQMRYKILELVGCGSSSKCYKCERKEDKKQFIVKIINFALLSLQYPDRVLQQLTREVSSLKKLKHANIVRLEEYFFCGEKLYIVEECLSGGELYSKVLQMQGIPENAAQEIFSQLALAVKYMHRANIVHRDIKPENILFVDQKSLKVKLIDFGFSRSMKGSFANSFLGTGGFLAPEIRLEVHGSESPLYTKAVDIWALGCVLYVMISACMPFDDSLYQRPKSDFELRFQPQKRWVSVSLELKDLLKRMLHPEPLRRYNASEVVQHAWVQQALKGESRTLQISISNESLDSYSTASDSMSAVGQEFDML